MAVDHAARAGWNVNLRRLAELMAANMPCLVLLFVPIVAPVLLGSHSLYAWNDPTTVAGDALLRGKAAYLNPGFFGVRLRDLPGRVVAARAFLLAAIAGTRPHGRSRADAQHGTLEPDRPAAVRGYGDLRVVRLAHVAFAAVVQHDFRRLFIRERWWDSLPP